MEPDTIIKVLAFLLTVSVSFNFMLYKTYVEVYEEAERLQVQLYCTPEEYEEWEKNRNQKKKSPANIIDIFWK